MKIHIIPIVIRERNTKTTAFVHVIGKSFHFFQFHQNIKYAYFWTQHMCVYKEARTKMFTAALFLVAKRRKT